MYASIQLFVQDYEEEATATQKLLDRLTDASLKQEVATGYRTLGHLAWHIACSGMMVAAAGVKFEHPDERGGIPSSAQAIADAYRKAVPALVEAVKSQWTDADLAAVQNIFGQNWSNGTTLNKFIKHEVHHRGQLTILMRQAGLQVAGIYGPAKEEWSAIGMEAPAL
ncbi:DinB family protein [Cohnella panacarvi]|uniref:DinB family protein n=1 Tax=Cohnella panacarvi TaxID=400776 RepID=UPI00047A1F32|nr:DinB family protein [Cohnella panacarvi]